MSDFHLLILDWYRLNKRSLPWRETNDPYYVWLSEVILQQTRVDQGKAYYEKFVRNYPTINVLSQADEQMVLNDWQGLGYYSRARNLHATAKFIDSTYGNEFPDTYTELMKLKGIGDYTASAISSIAFNEKQAAVDGNVYRVLSRIFDIGLAIDSTEGKKYFRSLAQELIPDENPGEYNQAVMEFGAIQCTPKKPGCIECPFENKCLSYLKGKHLELPVKKNKTKVRNRYFYYFLFEQDGKIVLQQRVAKDIWQNLFQFPLLESDKKLEQNELGEYLKSKFQVSHFKISDPIIHILSHQRIFCQFVHVCGLPSIDNTRIVDFADLDNFPLPRLIDRYLEGIKGRYTCFEKEH